MLASGCSEKPPANFAVSVEGDWQVVGLSNDRSYPAQVPGNVLQDLYNAGVIEHPYLPEGEEILQWIEKEQWAYACPLKPTQEVLNHEHQLLVFEGLDTYATIYLDGEELGKTGNAFRAFSFDVTGKLSADSELKVVFESPVKRWEEAAKSGKLAAMAGNDAGGVKVSPYVRKPAYHFGWDWAPRFVVPGITGKVKLEGWSGAKIEQVYAHCELTANAGSPKVIPVVYLDVLMKAEHGLFVEVKLSDENQQWANYYTAEEVRPTQHVPLNLPSNIQHRLMNGEVFRAKVLTRVITTRGAHVEEHQIPLKLSTFHLDQSVDSIGTAFRFLKNGEPIFIKGANFVPAGVMDFNDEEKIKKILDLAKASGMNMIRVWGGGSYQPDWFYAHCDAIGLMVWQDFMFAGAMYPTDSAFRQEVMKEAIYQLKRLRKFDCVKVWCGNNEIDVAWHNWGRQEQANLSATDSAALWEGYVHWFEEELPALVRKYHRTASYVSTSPTSNWGTPENFNHGSMHYWGVWHGNDDFDGFEKNVPRFMVEYGFQSLPTGKALEMFASDTSTMRDPHVIARQKSYKGYAELSRHIAQYFEVPDSVLEYAVKSQLVQAIAMEKAITAHRLAVGHCDGTMYWQLNDCWPGPSWSTIDYFGHPKAAHYRLKELYAEILPVATFSEEGIQLKVLSPYPYDQLSITMVAYTDSSKEVLQEIKYNPQASSQNVAVYDINDAKGTSRNAKAYKVIISKAAGYQNNEVRYEKVAERIVWRTAYPEMKTAKSQIEISHERTNTAGTYTLVLKSANLQRDVVLSAPFDGVTFEDNFFTLLPGETKNVTYHFKAGTNRDYKSISCQTITF